MLRRARTAGRREDRTRCDERDEAIEVGGSPELLGLAEEVQKTGKARLLRRDGELLAMIVPLPTGGARRLKPRRLSAEDIAAFRAAAGTWADVDIESLLADLYAAPDLLIAATARRYELTLVTRNLRHFQRVPGLRIYQQP